MLESRLAAWGLFQWTNWISRRRQRGAAKRAAASCVRPLAERLEPRQLLALVAELGEIANPPTTRVLNDLAIEPFNGRNQTISFSLAQSAELHVLLSDAKTASLNPLLEHFADLAIVSFDASGNIANQFASASLIGDKIELSAILPAGNYSAKLDVFNFKSVDLAFHADTAPALINADGNSSALTGHNLGTLSTATGVDLTEFVGQSAPTDFVDMYFFNLVKQGTVQVVLSAFANNDLEINYTIFRDFNGDGVFQRGTAEQIATQTGIGPGGVAPANLTLPAAVYGIEVTLTSFGFIQGNNYRLRTTYTVADGAGNTLAAARNAGTVGNSTVTFNDYIASNDSADIYKFTTVAGGPFVFASTLSGMAQGSNFDLDFIRDLDADGVIDSNEVTSSDRAGNGNDELNVSYTPPGTYFVRVRRVAGEGNYTLQFANRNSDLAGNTLPTARNFGTLFGHTDFTDSVSSTDTDDFYRFTLDRQAEFRARLTAMPAGTNANLFLIRDSDADGVIDAGETLASSSNAGNAAESILRNLTAGTYIVRVQRVAGTASYNLRLVKDAVGNTLPAALTLSASGGGALDFLGPEDDTDVYKFTLGSIRLAGISVGLNNEPLLVRLGRDTNGNGLLDDAELVINKTLAAGAGELQRINLGPGTWFLLVNATIQDEGTTYGVTVFNERLDLAGNTLAAARDLGVLSAQRTFTDFVGDGSLDLMDDLDDFYRFTVGNNGPFSFNAQFSSLTADANLQLIRDDNLNGAIDNGEILRATTVTGTGLDSLNVTLLVPGTHYLRVFRSSGQADYSLQMSAPSTDTAGNSLGTALNLGTLGTSNSLNHFVGRIDLDDFFRFSVTAPGELLAVLSSVDSSMRIDVIRDADNDLNIDFGEILASSDGFVGANDVLNGVFLPVAGTYFVRAQSVAGDSTYNIGVQYSIQTPFAATPFQISAASATTIQAEQFDNGGEDIAYNDTTTGNDNGASRADQNVDIKTTADSGGGFRTAGTAVGEFLEYTINVTQTGLYDFDFRVSSPDPGATFHVEIDGANVTGSVTMPDTNSFDAMTTVTRSAVPLTAGPHILRFVHDTATTAGAGFAGNLNFIRIRPATTGTFELTPPQNVVRAGEHATLALQWTVPFGGWRVLKDVELRLRDERGTVALIKFDEAANTFSLFNPATGKFGRARTVGSEGVLANRYVTIHLRGSTVQAAGPTAPSITITFDITFKKPARGRHFDIEAAASDDLGHIQEFAFAGTLDVLSKPLCNLRGPTPEKAGEAVFLQRPVHRIADGTPKTAPAGLDAIADSYL